MNAPAQRTTYANTGLNSNVTEAIILAGGLGTRLRSAVPDLPKCMAPVAGRPFIAYVIDHLRLQGVEHLVFSLGYMSEAIEAYLASAYPQMRYSIVVEPEPLGTGGAIQFALRKTTTSTVLLLNGDTLFQLNVRELATFHQRIAAECTLCLKPMNDFSRYGVVETDSDGKVVSFKEKKAYVEGLINGGVYLLQKEPFLARNLPQKFSFESDYLERFTPEGRFFAAVQDTYFIDIGIPEDFQKAQTDLDRRPFSLHDIDTSWTLFLDRDGVVNDELPGNYVRNWSEFRFAAGVLPAMRVLAGRFGKILIVSNQRGIGKGLMTTEDIQHIHANMLDAVHNAGGRIDGIFFCTETNDDCFYRKPNPGMATQAVQRFPSIDMRRAVIVGDKQSDMQFGRAAGMYTVFVTSTNAAPEAPHPHIDLVLPSLAAFASALQS